MPEIDPRVLPDAPGVWSIDLGGYVQRWLPGAFGDRDTIEGLHAFKIDEDRWHKDSDDGVWRRTIIKAHEVDRP